MNQHLNIELPEICTFQFYLIRKKLQLNTVHICVIYLSPSPAPVEVARRAKGKDTPCDVSLPLDGFYSRGQWRRIGHIFIVLRNLTTQNDVAVLIHLCRETVMMTPGPLSS